MTINQLIEDFDNWYKKNELTNIDMEAVRLVFLLNNFTLAYGRSHNLEDYDYNTANRKYSDYFSQQKIIINLLGMLCYVWHNAGGENQRIKEEIRDDENETYKIRMNAIKELTRTNYQKIAMYLYQTALKERIFEIDESRKNQVNKYLIEQDFDIKTFRGFNKIFTNSEKTCIKNFILGKKIVNPINKDGEEELDFFLRKEVIGEVMHLLNIMVQCFNSKNIKVLNEIKVAPNATGENKLNAITLLEKINQESFIIQSYAPKCEIIKKIKVEFTDNSDQIDWGDEEEGVS